MNDDNETLYGARDGAWFQIVTVTHILCENCGLVEVPRPKKRRELDALIRDHLNKHGGPA